MGYKVYDFVCQDCGKQFEKLVKSAEGIECPFCGVGKVVKQISATSFKVGGQGVYDRKMKV